jgi:hypothetical protein
MLFGTMTIKKAIIIALVSLAILWGLAFGLIAYLVSGVNPNSLNVSVEEYRATTGRSIGGFAGYASGFIFFVMVLNIAKAVRDGRDTDK